jgi:hypothetical protein
MKGATEMIESQTFISRAKSLRKMSSGMKGATELIEYMFMVLFLIVIIFGFILFLSWWENSQLKMEKFSLQTDEALTLMGYMASSPFLARETGMLDDAKITALQNMGQDGCIRFRAVYKKDFFITVNTFDRNENTPCTNENFPECNSWKICVENGRNATSYVLPVNIYRNIGVKLSTGILGSVYVGNITVGVYHD